MSFLAQAVRQVLRQVPNRSLSLAGEWMCNKVDVNNVT